MLEIVIERWTSFERGTDYRWSIWSDGHRIEIGPHAHGNADDCEAEALEFCVRALGRQPDKITRL